MADYVITGGKGGNSCSIDRSSGVVVTGGPTEEERTERAFRQMIEECAKPVPLWRRVLSFLGLGK